MKSNLLKKNQRKKKKITKKNIAIGSWSNPFLEKMRIHPLTEQKCSEYSTSDGLPLFYRKWIPKMKVDKRDENLEISKLVVCLHGLHSHGQKFVLLADHLAQFTESKSWRVVAPDLRGHGLSWNESNPRGDILDFSLWLADIIEFISFLRKQYPKSSIFIVAESMGAAVSILTTIKIQKMINGLVLLSPALKPFALAEITLIQKSFTYGLIGGIERPNIKDRGQGRFSTNSQAYIQYQMNDLLRLDKVTPRYYYQVIKMVHQLKPLDFSNFVPSCIFYGDKDVVVDLQGMKEYIRRLGGTDKALHLIPNAFHELLTDVQAQKYHILNKIKQWIDSH